MSAEGFEEWDADFLDQLIQVEEMAISCTNPTVPQPLPYLSSYLQPQPEPPSLPTHYGVSHGNISYSPPRELSQRIKNSGKSVACSSNGSVCGGHITGSSVVKIAGNGNELEIDRLKVNFSCLRLEISLCSIDGWKSRNLKMTCICNLNYFIPSFTLFSEKPNGGSYLNLFFPGLCLEVFVYRQLFFMDFKRIGII